MNILFLTLVSFDSFSEQNIYTDLLRKFISQGDKVIAISPIESRFKRDTEIVEEGSSTILRLRIGDVTKTHPIKKGINTLLLDSLYLQAVKKYFEDIKFDLVIYSTPCTLANQ